MRSGSLPSFSALLIRRLFPAICIALVLLAASAATLLWFQTKVRLRDERSAAAQLAAEHVAGELQAMKANLRGIAHSTTFSANPDGPRRKLAPQASRNIAGFAAMLLVEGNDTVSDVVLAPGSTRKQADLFGLNLSRMPAYIEARDQGQPRLAWNMLDDRQLLLIAEPIDRGSLVLLVDPLAIAWPEPDTPGRFKVILDEGQRPIFASGDVPEAAITEFGRTITLPGPDRLSTLDVQHTTYLATRTEIPGTRWTVLLCDLRSAAYASYLRSVGIIAAITAAIAAGILLAISLLCSHATSPMCAIAAATPDEESPPIATFAELEALSYRIRQLTAESQQKDIRLRRVDDILAYVAEGPSARPNQDFFQALAQELAAATQTRCVLIAEWIAGAKPRASIMATRCAVPLPNDFAYELIGNPCHQLANRPFVHIQRGISRQFPESMLLRLLGAEGYVAVALVMGDGSIGGHIELINDHELIVGPELRDLLMAVATRSAAELERLRTARQIDSAQRLDRELHIDLRELVCRCAPDGTITYLSEAALGSIGKTAQELIGSSILTLVHEEDRTRFWHHLEQLRSGVAQIDIHLRAADGRLRWLRCTGRAILDEHGRVTEYQNSGEDISALRELETALGESHALLELFRSNVPVAIWIADWASHRCTWISSAMESLWPTPAAELLNAPMAWTAAIHEEDRARVVRNYLLHAEEGAYQEQYRIVLANSDIRWLRSKATPIRARDGSLKQVVSFAEDVTHLHTSSQSSIP